VSGGYTRAFELNAAFAVIGIVAMAFAKMPTPRNATLSEAQAA
jgi:hypothetical protein